VKHEILDSHGRMHHGLIADWQLPMLGVTVDDWHRSVGSGLIIELHPGVARIAGAPPTREQTILAGVWAYGSKALVVGRRT
jgi:hypothetical protein